jgi:flagellar hook protein FlgE
MNAIGSIALSGMNAAQLRLGSSAHNIANALTPGFRRQLVVQQSVPEGGVQASVTRAALEGPALADDLVAQMSAGYLFIANLKAIQTQDRLMGSLLDIRA